MYTYFLSCNTFIKLFFQCKSFALNISEIIFQNPFFCLILVEHFGCLSKEIEAVSAHFFLFIKKRFFLRLDFVCKGQRNYIPLTYKLIELFT